MNQPSPPPQSSVLVDPRIAEILGSVRRAFAEKGFDGASMQDLARAAGMSVGNFYRYFRSKDAIVVALIENDLCAIEADFAAVLTAPHPFARLKEVIRQRLPQHQDLQHGDLWAEITAVAQRNSEIGTAACRMEARIATAMVGVIARETGLPPEEAARRFAAEAAYILLLFHAATASGSARSALRDPLNALIIATIDQILDTIAQRARDS